MFQDFSPPASPVVGDTRLKKLRQWMLDEGVSVVVIPHADEQNNEYLPADKERLAWVTGFTGSAGSAIVSNTNAVLFVDGRYTLQAAEQADGEHWEIESLTDNPPAKWIGTHCETGDLIAIDPWLHTASQVKALSKAAAGTNATLRMLTSNPIDQIWLDRPAAPLGAVKIHDFKFAGKTTREKMQQMNAALGKASADFCVLTDPSSVCWLFNIRGADVAHTPIVLAHAILRTGDEPILFIDEKKLDIETRAFLTQVAILADPSDMTVTLAKLAKSKAVMLDENVAAYAISALVENAGGTVVVGTDPVSLPRAIKNDIEIEGTRSAHLRDGAAFCNFLHWLDEQRPGTVDEITAAQKLEEFRSKASDEFPLKDISFDTISGSGPNGAIVHYRVNAQSNRVLQEGELYLCDSGAQFDDGTTDITRTIAIGEPSNDQRRTFTLVLKGHIAIALARFPKGTRGVELDPLARMALWQHGMDYGHGTGHGVGSYLSVHEGPQSISKRGMQELLPGMIVSNEPGYYRAGAFGIRIENLVLVTKPLEIPNGDAPMLGFETLTLAPIDQRLIDATMLTDDELHWLNAYHGWVKRQLSDKVDAESVKWLSHATSPMVRDLPPASA